MKRLDTTFAAAAKDGRPLVIPFVTAGFPQLDSTVGVVTAMAQAGADIVEIGMPFSDPLADGPTIQRSSERALANGMTVAGVLGLVETLRSQPSTEQLPLVLMGYCNPIFHYGLERFVAAAAAAGVDGLIVPDLPPEEAEEYRDYCADGGIAAVFLMAPNAPDHRIRTVDAASTHFSYCVSLTGVTGARGGVASHTVEFLRRVRRLAAKPFVVGFGVRGAEQVLELGPEADGVVVGSALIDLMDGAEDPAAVAATKVAELVAAARQISTDNHPTVSESL